MKVTAVIPAAGTGKRVNAKKQFLELDGKSILAITVSVFEECQSVDEIIVAVGKEDVPYAQDLLNNFGKVKKVIAGGPERQDSVYNCIKEMTQESDDDIVVIHDGARPLVTKEIISNAITEAKTLKAVVAGVTSKDTVKVASADNVIMETLDRATIWLAQTPQAFHFSLIKQAYERAEKIGYKATDDSKLVERMGISVKMIKGSYENIKITTLDDLSVAEAILKQRKK